jgi:hypothetical protein
MARLTILLVALIAAMATAFAPVPLSRTGELDFCSGGTYTVDFCGREEVPVVARVPVVCTCLWSGSECFDAQIVACLIESRRQYFIVPLIL